LKFIILTAGSISKSVIIGYGGREPPSAPASRGTSPVGSPHRDDGSPLRYGGSRAAPCPLSHHGKRDAYLAAEQIDVVGRLE
jgi:hypothetical protein